MLIEFSVANFRSLRESQTLSLAKAKGGELVESNTFAVQAYNRFELLRSAAIYGPNASGKSNLLLALRTMRQVVLESATMQRGDPLPVTPFRLHPLSTRQPSEFEVSFIVGEVRYQYGFSASATRIYEEWLLAYPKGRPQRWFGRIWDEQRAMYEWELGNNLSGEKQLWQKSTRDNALFLSTAVQLNSEPLQPIYDWFKKTLCITPASGWPNAFSRSLCEQSAKARVIDFLRAADLDIDDIQVEKQPFDAHELPSDMPESLRAAIADDMKNKIKTVHKDSSGESIVFDLADESDGTQKVFALAGPWLGTLSNGYVLFIDELHGNLHPRLVQFLVQLFQNQETNPNNAQLIFTTHETSILTQEVFRRDQIWFCEKTREQATSLYPLTDFTPRKGPENLKMSYLSGCYGAMPYIRSLQQGA